MTTQQNQTSKKASDFLRYTAATDIGMRRDENQDSYGVVQNSAFRFFIVADGMGGVQGGATASKMAVNVVEQRLIAKTNLTAEDICEAVTVANKLIFEKGAGDVALNGMGTTFVGIAFVENKMFVTNVGDSRAYCFRNNTVRRLTEDHTLVMELVRSGTITVEQAGNHPVSHMLTRSLGPTPEIEIDCYLAETGPLAGDVFLLCSDGLYNMVAESEMLEIISGHGIDQATELLIDLANQRGGTDNITLILIKADDAFPADPAIIEAAKLEEEELAAERALNGEDTERDPTIPEFDPFAIPDDVEPLKKPETPPVEPAKPVEQPEPEKVAIPVSEEKEKSEDFIAPKLGVPAEIPEGVEPHKVQSWIMMGILAGISGGAIAVLISTVIMMSVNDKSVTSDEIQPTEDLPIEPPDLTIPLSNIPVVKIPEIKKDDSIVLSMRPDTDQGPTSTDRIEGNSVKIAQENLERRRSKLESSIQDLIVNISRFSEPAGGDAQKAILEEKENREKLKEQLAVARNDLEAAKRKLAIWYGRKTRVKESDLTNFASEVAVTSPTVREKKEEFERASWNYLKEAEALRYMPSDQAQRRKVEELVEVRNAKIQEMGDAVNAAIEEEIAESEKAITELTLNKDRLQDQIEQLDTTIQSLEILLGEDETAKVKRKEELENLLISYKSELNELQNFLPIDEAKKPEPSKVEDLTPVN